MASIRTERDFVADSRRKSTAGRRRWRLGRAKFPKNLAQDAERELGVRSGKVEAADEPADFLFGGSGSAPLLGTVGTRFQIAAGAEGVEQECGEALQIGGRGGDMFFQLHGCLWIARKFVQAHGN